MNVDKLILKRFLGQTVSIILKSYFVLTKTDYEIRDQSLPVELHTITIFFMGQIG